MMMMIPPDSFRQDLFRWTLSARIFSAGPFPARTSSAGPFPLRPFSARMTVNCRPGMTGPRAP
eukprot:11925218-Karenia_brevis.AAC.1